MLAFTDSELDRLTAIGLSPELRSRAERCADIATGATAAPLRLERVSAVHRDTVRLHDGRSERSARPLPRLARALLDAGTALAVGDWVLATAAAEADIGWVHTFVPPVSHIARRDGDGGRHPVVSNVDRALVVMGLDDDFNLRRLERYLALVHGAAVAPVIVLTKADVAAAEPALRDARLAELAARIPGAVPTVVVDATDPATAAHFERWIGAGQTLVLLGSSGAGKSTLTNTLLGRATQDTGAVREHDSRGMHTTTSRTLHLLPGGGCVIDTPGLRTLRPDADEATLVAGFADVESLAARCRFRDCTHGDEPGCAVRAGVDPDRLRNFHKLLRETRRDTMGWLERRGQLSAWKSRGKAVRERMKLKRGVG